MCRELSAHASCANQRAVTGCVCAHDIGVSQGNIGADKRSPRNVRATKVERTDNDLFSAAISAEQSAHTQSADRAFVLKL
jgi:hypothetical protein